MGEANGFYDIDREIDDEEMKELRALGKHIGKVKNIHMQKNKRERRIQQAQVNRMASSKSAGSARDLKNNMRKLGLELENWYVFVNGMDDGDGSSNINAVRVGRTRESRKRKAAEDMEALLEGEEQLKVKRSESRPGPRDNSGIRDEKMYDKAIKKQDKHRKLHKVAGKYGGRN